MKRRDFIKMLGVIGASSALPLGVASAFASDKAPALPIPGLLKSDASGQISINIQEGQTSWFGKSARTWGYNGALLGPTLSLRRGEKVNMNVTNSLPESTALHWHGLEVPGVVDGGPQAMISAGGNWRPSLEVQQEAATCWYHPHPHGRTGKQVAMGLGGFLIVEDEISDKLDIPKNYGVDDIPVVIQDKRLDEKGQIDYEMDIMTASVGWFGDLMLTNGEFYPEHAAPKGWVRLRLLNGCNARSLRLACSDRRPMYVIASDGGFIEAPVRLTELTLYMGERFEVLIDLSKGIDFDLLSLPVSQPGMNIPPFDRPVPVLRLRTTGQRGHKNIPQSLVKLPPIPDTSNLPVRYIELSMNHRLMMQGMMGMRENFGGSMGEARGMMGRGMMGGGMRGRRGMMGGRSGSSGMDIWNSNFINGRPFTMNYSSFDVKIGQYEKWVIRGTDMMLHPFHVHGTQFRILRENSRVPELHRRGFKDITLVQGGESVFVARFMHPAPKERMYMAHCHLLEHEDTGMMMSFTTSA